VPLVFVHGVTVRDNPTYRAEVRARDAYFRRFVLAELLTDSKSATILNPLWGDHGARFRWGHASLPSGATEALGPEDQMPAVLLAEEGILDATDQTVLLKIAQRSLVDVIDILWAAEAPLLKGDEVAPFAEQAARALDYAKYNPRPAWLEAAKNDDQLVRDLLKAIDDWTLEPAHILEVLGSRTLKERIREAAARLRGVFGRGTGVAILTVGRSIAHRKFALFFGDVFEYLARRGTPERPGAIPNAIIRALREGRARITETDDKLIVVAHSMGGNIVYDVMTSFAGEELQVDVLVTVGSQIGLFEELKLFTKSDEAIPNAQRPRVPRHRSIVRWLNVFDINDILGFAAERIFDGVEDLAYSTGKGVVGAHVTYFLRPSFYERLGARLREMVAS
jgi:hypothetical protein